MEKIAKTKFIEILKTHTSYLMSIKRIPAENVFEWVDKVDASLFQMVRWNGRPRTVKSVNTRGIRFADESTLITAGSDRTCFMHTCSNTGEFVLVLQITSNWYDGETDYLSMVYLIN